MMVYPGRHTATGESPVAAKRRVRLVLAVPLLSLWACGDGGAGPDEPPTVSTVTAVSGDAQSGVAGAVLLDSLIVRVADSDGNPIAGAAVNWSVETGGGSVPPTSSTSASGIAAVRWTLGTVTGSAAVRATASGKSATFSATITPAAVNAVAISPSSFTLEVGSQRQLQAVVTDLFSNVITGRTLVWESAEPLVATVDANGTVRGVGGGTAVIRATLDDRIAAASVTVTGAPAAVPTISAITPALLTPGVAATITGTNFATAPGASTVTVNGAIAAVTSASPTQLQVTLPGADQLGCTPAAPVEVVVSVGSGRAVRPHPLRTGTARALAVGEAIFGTANAGLGCTELAAGSGRYLVAVYNVGPAFFGSGQTLVNPGPGIQVRTATSPSGNITAPQPMIAAPSAASVRLADVSSRQTERLRRHLRLHETVMAANLELMPRVKLPRTGKSPGQAALVSQPAAVGDSIWIRFPDVSKSSSLTCSQFDSVRARVVHVGTRATVLEDLAAPLAGKIDNLYQQLGLQFDQVQYPVIRDHFGDPLALDAQLNNDGNLYMLFTRKVNNLLNGGILGFVWSGDFDDGTGCAQSNRAEIFYGFVPTVLSDGGSSDWDVDDWFNFSQATVVHEVKHVASMAARRANQNPVFAADSMWLEEATAMLAEELWARQVFGYQQRGNTGFDQSIRCELNLSGSGCTGMPVVMLNHFAFLYDYYEFPHSFSLLGKTGTDDATFYGSAWAFLRWLTDHSGMAEAQFLTGITQASTAGLTTIQALTGRSYEELVRDYVLAMALDDRPGTTTTNPRLSQPSWNTRDVFAGMSRLQTPSGVVPFPLEFPLVPRTLVPPLATLPEVRPGGAGFFELLVPSTSAQALVVLASDGSALPAGLRVAILRVQ